MSLGRSVGRNRPNQSLVALDALIGAQQVGVPVQQVRNIFGQKWIAIRPSQAFKKCLQKSEITKFIQGPAVMGHSGEFLQDAKMEPFGMLTMYGTTSSRSELSDASREAL